MVRCTNISLKTAFNSIQSTDVLAFCTCGKTMRSKFKAKCRRQVTFMIYMYFCFEKVEEKRRKYWLLDNSHFTALLLKASNFCCLNPFLHRYSFCHIYNRQLLKTLWEKEKLLETSNFSFSHNVFYSIR